MDFDGSENTSSSKEDGRVAAYAMEKIDTRVRLPLLAVGEARLKRAGTERPIAHSLCPRNDWRGINVLFREHLIAF